jgi:hypothetical protein
MSEWWTYSLGDLLMFAPRTYWRMGEPHKAALWPAQLAMGLAGVAAAAALWRRPASPLPMVVLAAAWIAVGGAFHARRYAQINWAADGFAAAFIVEGLLWLLAAVSAARSPAPERPAAERPPHAALALWLTALAGYPWLGWLAGRPWTQAEVFGIVPDPTALATLGILLATRAELPRTLRLALWIVPVGWCAVGGATLFAMHDPAWPLLPLAGTTAVALTWVHRGQPSGTNTQSSR